MNVTTKLEISLNVDCSLACAQFAWPLLNQMDSGKYDEMSVVNLQPLEDWRADHRTARKRADRAERRFYQFGRLAPDHWAGSLNAINQSAAYRQGRPMSPGYMNYQEFPPLPDYPCLRHAVRWYGVFHQDNVVAYAVIYRAGELALISQILGHADHLENEVMYLLAQSVMAQEHATDPHGYLVYNRHDSGTDGLRFFKERCGFVAMGVEWLP